jgi:glycosyltransferase involved in cell wall biosynthesis
MILAPIVIFAYNRPLHLRQTVEALLKNEYASDSDLIIYSDGYKDEKSREGVEKTREYIQSVTGFKSIKVVEREKNWGLASNIIDGVTTVVNKYGRIIVLEDDLLTSPYFLKYMNEGLEKYAHCEEIASIHGYLYPVKDRLPENFLLKHTDSLGWGTWKDSWTIFNPDGDALLKYLHKENLVRRFNFNNSYNFEKMLRYQVEGKNNSWAIRWYASAFLANKLSLFPNKSLVCHNGNDELGTNSSYGDDWLNVELSDTSIHLTDIPIEENEEVRAKYENFFRHTHGNLYKKIRKKIMSIYGEIKTHYR